MSFEREIRVPGENYNGFDKTLDVSMVEVLESEQFLADKEKIDQAVHEVFRKYCAKGKEVFKTSINGEAIPADHRAGLQAVGSLRLAYYHWSLLAEDLAQNSEAITPASIHKLEIKADKIFTLIADIENNPLIKTAGNPAEAADVATQREAVPAPMIHEGSSELDLGDKQWEDFARASEMYDEYETTLKRFQSVRGDLTDNQVHAVEAFLVQYDRLYKEHAWEKAKQMLSNVDLEINRLSQPAASEPNKDVLVLTDPVTPVVLKEPDVVRKLSVTSVGEEMPNTEPLDNLDQDMVSATRMELEQFKKQYPENKSLQAALGAFVMFDRAVQNGDQELVSQRWQHVTDNLKTLKAQVSNVENATQEKSERTLALLQKLRLNKNFTLALAAVIGAVAFEPTTISDEDGKFSLGGTVMTPDKSSRFGVVPVWTTATPEELAKATAEVTAKIGSSDMAAGKVPVTIYDGNKADVLPSQDNSFNAETATKYQYEVKLNDPNSFVENTVNDALQKANGFGLPPSLLEKYRREVYSSFMSDKEALRAAGISSGDVNMIFAGEIHNFIEPVTKFEEKCKEAFEKLKSPFAYVIEKEAENLSDIVDRVFTNDLNLIPDNLRNQVIASALNKYLATPESRSELLVKNPHALELGSLVDLRGLIPYIAKEVSALDHGYEKTSEVISDNYEDSDISDGEDIAEAPDVVINEPQNIKEERTPESYPGGVLAYSKAYNSLLESFSIKTTPTSWTDAWFAPAGKDNRPILAMSVGELTTIMLGSKQDIIAACAAEKIDPQVAEQVYSRCVVQARLNGWLDSSLSNQTSIAEVFKQIILKQS